MPLAEAEFAGPSPRLRLLALLLGLAALLLPVAGALFGAWFARQPLAALAGHLSTLAGAFTAGLPALLAIGLLRRRLPGA